MISGNRSTLGSKHLFISSKGHGVVTDAQAVVQKLFEIRKDWIPDSPQGQTHPILLPPGKYRRFF